LTARALAPTVADMVKQLMGVVVAIGLLGAGCGGSDGLTPREGCEQLVGALCGQLYECLTAAEIDDEGLPPTEAACTSMLQTVLGCASQTTENTCDAGQTYKPEKAEDCVGQIESLSCTQVRDSTTDIDALAPACEEVCAI
jgi:hypothetical protein